MWKSRSGLLALIVSTLISVPSTSQVHDEIGNVSPIYEPQEAQDRRRSIDLLERDADFTRLFPGTTKKDYLSSQHIVCPRKWASAVLVCDARTVVTNFHALDETYKNFGEHSIINRGDKLESEAYDLCYFTPDYGETKYYLEPVARANLHLQVGTLYYGTVGQHGSDWAILRLKKPVPTSAARSSDIVYLEDDQLQRIIPTTEMRLLHIAGAGDEVFQEPYYQICTPSRPSRDRNGNYYVPTDCLSDRGSSGSGLFLNNGRRSALMAIAANMGHTSNGSGRNYQGTMAFSERFAEAMRRQTNNLSCMASLDQFLGRVSD